MDDLSAKHFRSLLEFCEKLMAHNALLVLALNNVENYPWDQLPRSDPHIDTVTHAEVEPVYRTLQGKKDSDFYSALGAFLGKQSRSGDH